MCYVFGLNWELNAEIMCNCNLRYRLKLISTYNILIIIANEEIVNCNKCNVDFNNIFVLLYSKM